MSTPRSRPRSRPPNGRLCAYVCLGMLIAGASSARAEEGRFYLRGDYSMLRVQRAPWDLSLGGFLKIEDRFRAAGLVYEKLSAGTRLQLLPWLSTQLYFAHQVNLDSSNKQKWMAVGDLILVRRLGDVRLLNRNGNEWHVTDEYYRYRGYFEVLWQRPRSWVSPWASEELRVDSDQRRVNQNDVRAGVELLPSKLINVRLFYDYESQRRNEPGWQGAWYVGLSVGLRAGVGEEAVAPPAPVSSGVLGHD